MRRKKFRGFKVMTGIVGGPEAREFSKIDKKFIKKIAKMHYVSLFFPKNLKLQRLMLACLDEYHNWLWKIFLNVLMKIHCNASRST